MLHTLDDLHAAREYVRASTKLLEAIGSENPDVVEIEWLGAGEHNFNYRLRNLASAEDYVLRVNVVPQVFHKDQISYEYCALKALEGSGCTPKAFYMDNSKAALREGVLLTGFCVGDELDFDRLRPGDLRCAAQLMADVHAVPVDQRCGLRRPHDPFDDLWSECSERFEAYRVSGAEDPRISKWVGRFCSRTREALEKAGSPGCREHIVHTETLPSHFIIPAEAAQMAACNQEGTGRFCDNPGWIIDWERPVIAEPAQDVAYFTGPTMTYWDSEYMFPAKDVESFVDDYWRAVDGRFERKNFDERFAAYRMLTTLRSVGWCCKRLGRYGSVSGIQGTDKTARKLPVLLSDEFLELLATDVFGL